MRLTEERDMNTPENDGFDLALFTTVRRSVELLSTYLFGNPLGATGTAPSG